MMDILNSSNHSSTVHIDSLLCFESLSGSCVRLARPHSMQLPMVIFMGITTLVTVIGNLLVITSIVHFKQLHTPTNCLILSLAVCDFLVGLFVIPFSAGRSVQGCWYLGEFLCKLHLSNDIMLSTSSIFHLCSISIERYYAVCSPLRYRAIICSSTVLIMVATSWLAPSIFAYGMIFTELNVQGSESFFEADSRCLGGCNVFFSRVSAVGSSLFSFFIPGLIMFCIYLRIYVAARNQARSIKYLANQLRMTKDHKCSHLKHRMRKGTTTLAIVVGVFLICWTPFFLCTIINPFIEYVIPALLTDALTWFGYFNSTLNPFIYAFFYPWFRKALKIIVSGNVSHGNTCRVQLHSY